MTPPALTGAVKTKAAQTAKPSEFSLVPARNLKVLRLLLVNEQKVPQRPATARACDGRDSPNAHRSDTVSRKATLPRETRSIQRPHSIQQNRAEGPLCGRLRPDHPANLFGHSCNQIIAFFVQKNHTKRANISFWTLFGPNYYQICPQNSLQNHTNTFLTYFGHFCNQII